MPVSLYGMLIADLKYFSFSSLYLNRATFHQISFENKYFEVWIHKFETGK